MKDIQKLENVQKFALKVCCKRWDLTYAEALEQTALPDLKARRTHLNLCYFYKLINGFFEFPNSPLTTRQLNYPTRSGRTNLYYQPYAHSNSFLHSFFPQTISLWNLFLSYLFLLLLLLLLIVTNVYYCLMFSLYALSTCLL